MSEHDFRSELDQLYAHDDVDNIMDDLEIESKYYEVDELTGNSSQYKYRILHLNIQGLLSSLEKLKHLINKLESNYVYIDFILICETFLRGTDSESSIMNACAISGYDFVYKSRMNMSKGGVGIYINWKYQYSIRHDLSVFIEGEFENIFVEIKSIPQNAIVGEIYRVPNTPARESVTRYENVISNILTNKAMDFIIASDQNMDFLRINEINYIADLFNIYVSNGIIPVI